MTCFSGAARLHAASVPSFSCAKAATAIEKSICTNERLAAADTELSVLFANVRSRFDVKRRESFLAGQRIWLKLREQACPPSQITAVELQACLKRLYGWRRHEVSRLAALLDKEAVQPNAPKVDIDAVLDRRRELVAYFPSAMSAMHRYVNGEWVDAREPQTCRELNALVEGDVWQYGTDTIGMNNQNVANVACEYALQEALKWPSAAPVSDHDPRFDDMTKYSWEWANLSGVGEDYQSDHVRSFASEQAAGKIKIVAVPEGKCDDGDADRETMVVEPGKTDGFCFGGWRTIFNKRLFGDFTHRGRVEALVMYTVMPSGIGTYRAHGLLSAYYDPATDSIRPDGVRNIFAADHDPAVSDDAAKAIAPDADGSSPPPSK